MTDTFQNCDLDVETNCAFMEWTEQPNAQKRSDNRKAFYKTGGITLLFGIHVYNGERFHLKFHECFPTLTLFYIHKGPTYLIITCFWLYISHIWIEIYLKPYIKITYIWDLTKLHFNVVQCSYLALMSFVFSNYYHFTKWSRLPRQFKNISLFMRSDSRTTVASDKWHKYKTAALFDNIIGLDMTRDKNCFQL